MWYSNTAWPRRTRFASLFLRRNRRLRRTLAVILIQQGLAQAHKIRRHFDIFIMIDVLERLFERELVGGRDLHLSIRARRAHVRKLLRLLRITLRLRMLCILRLLQLLFVIITRLRF